MRRSSSVRWSSWVLALVLTLTTLVGGATAGPQPAGPGTAPAPGAMSPGQLCVVKFNDLNGDGRQDPGEPALAGWTFQITNDDLVAVGLIGTAPGVNRCIDLLAATYTVTETAQTGWTATTVGGPTQTVSVASGETTTVTFGNREVDRGHLCVETFEDRNASGAFEPGEPMLSKWSYAVVEQPTNAAIGTLVSGTATKCIDVRPGTFIVTQAPQVGWLPTTPGAASQTAIVAAGQTVTLRFGNKHCCLPFSHLAGKTDVFSVGDGATAEPVTPVSITASPRYFDGTKVDTTVAHRFTLGKGNCISSASLSMQLKALGSDSSNDTLSVKVSGSSSWSRRIGGLAPGFWRPPNRGTVSINLGSMPVGTGSHNLLPALNTIRVLDVTIQDDTSVDYLWLTVMYCECVQP